MFDGNAKHTIDPKGRLIIPTKFREELGECFKMTRGMDGCLFLFPMDEWDAFEAKLKQLPMMDKDARKLCRFFTTGATTCELDKQGRILLSSVLRSYAQIDKEVVFAGTAGRLELWSSELYDEIENYENVDEVAERVHDKFNFSI